MNVFITVDTEIWCRGWANLDQQFPDQFRKYVYGPTARGDYALPATISILQEFGLRGVFFVEPLFSARFGLAPLAEIVGLITEAAQEVQLHLHPEWVDEAGDGLLKGVTQKIPMLRQCNEDQQYQLVDYGVRRLTEAGAENINALRAGSYAANLDTLKAAARSGLLFDSSYNPYGKMRVGDIAPGEVLTQPRMIEGVFEYPVSVFRDYSGRGFRHLQVTACAYREFEYCLNKASDAGWDSIVIVTHNFELLTADKSRADTIVVNRFRRMCRFLSKHSDRFNVCGFSQLQPRDVTPQPPVIDSNPAYTVLRTVEQLARRLRYA